MAGTLLPRVVGSMLVFAGVLVILGNGGHPALIRWLLTATALALAGGTATWLLAGRRRTEERLASERNELETERGRLIEALHSQARRDPLTGLPNRRWLEEELPRELARSRRLGSDLCVAMIDLDHFSEFNDRHGHSAGDRLLAESARRWRTALRASDFIARYGGEEFVVLLPDCPPADARAVVERLRAATPEGQTCSSGIACWDPDESADSLVVRAEAALYEAKTSGRNRSVLTEAGLVEAQRAQLEHGLPSDHPR